MTDPVKTCANCGHMQSSGEFCEACGTKLPAAAPVPPVPPPVPASAVAAGVAGSASGPSTSQASGYAASPQSGPPPTQAHGYSSSPGYDPPPRRDDGFWSRFFDLSFEHFITPSIIKVLFILAMVVIGLGVLGWIIFGFVTLGALGIFTLIGALIGGFIYLLMARVFLEMVVVFFRIRDDTEELTRLKR